MKTTRDAVRNKIGWERRRTPTQDPGTDLRGGEAHALGHGPVLPLAVVDAVLPRMLKYGGGP